MPEITLRSAIPRTIAIPAEAFAGGLPLEAIGLLARMIAKPENWQFRRAALEAECDIAHGKLDRILNELTNCGWLTKRSRGAPRRGWDWIIHMPAEAEKYRKKTPKPSPAPAPAAPDIPLPRPVAGWLASLREHAPAWEVAWRQGLPLAAERAARWARIDHALARSAPTAAGDYRPGSTREGPDSRWFAVFGEIEYEITETTLKNILKDSK